MTSHQEFSNLIATARELGSRTDDLTAAELRKLLCHDCDFYTEDHEEDLECSCFQILRLVIKRGVLSPAQLAQAVKPREAEK
ncbi:MAG: hypothetical protein WC828_09195 [Thermoleophilia bacterium]